MFERDDLRTSQGLGGSTGGGAAEQPLPMVIAAAEPRAADPAFFRRSHGRAVKLFSASMPIVQENSFFGMSMASLGHLLEDLLGEHRQERGAEDVVDVAGAGVDLGAALGDQLDQASE
jgi:hypothetical protein